MTVTRSISIRLRPAKGAALPTSLSKHITLALAALAALGFALPPPTGAQSNQIRRFVGIYSGTRQGTASAQPVQPFPHGRTENASPRLLTRATTERRSVR